MGIISVLFGCLFSCVSKKTDEDMEMAQWLDEKPSTELALAPPISDPISQGYWEFCISMMKSIPSAHTSVICSPLSIGISLATMMNGSKGETQAQIRQLIGNGSSIEQVNAFYSNICSSVLSSSLPNWIARLFWKKGLVVPCSLGTGIFYDKCLKIDQKFASEVGRNFKALFKSLNFNDSNEAAKVVNAFAFEKTDGKVSNAVSESDFSDLHCLLLVNTVLMKPLWKLPFDRVYSEKRRFYGLMEERVVECMNNSYSDAPFLICSDLSAICLPFKHDGGKFVAIMPQGDFKNFLETLTVDRVRTIINAMRPDSYVSVEVTVPKFSTEFSFDATETLKNLGLDAIFDESRADMSGLMLTGPIAYVGRVEQKASIEIDEVGVVAAAETSVNYVVLGPTPKINLLKPFVYFIIQDDIIVFTGQYV